MRKKKKKITETIDWTIEDHADLKDKPKRQDRSDREEGRKAKATVKPSNIPSRNRIFVTSPATHQHSNSFLVDTLVGLSHKEKGGTEGKKEGRKQTRKLLQEETKQSTANATSGS